MPSRGAGRGADPCRRVAGEGSVGVGGRFRCRPAAEAAGQPARGTLTRWSARLPLLSAPLPPPPAELVRRGRPSRVDVRGRSGELRHTTSGHRAVKAEGGPTRPDLT